MPGDRQSSPDLQTQLLMDMRSEAREGFKTLHDKFDRLDDKLETHARDDVHTASVLRGEIADVRDEHSRTRERLAAIEANSERDAEVRTAGGFPSVNGTGRYHVVPPAGTGAPIVQINTGDSSERKSVPPWVSATWPYVKRYAIPAVIVVATAAWHFLTGTDHLKIVQIPASPPATSLQMPAPSVPDLNTAPPSANGVVRAR